MVAKPPPTFPGSRRSDGQKVHPRPVNFSATSLVRPLWLGAQYRGHLVSRPDPPSLVHGANELERSATVLCIYGICGNSVAEFKKKMMSRLDLWLEEIY